MEKCSIREKRLVQLKSSVERLSGGGAYDNEFERAIREVPDVYWDRPWSNDPAVNLGRGASRVAGSAGHLATDFLDGAFDTLARVDGGIKPGKLPTGPFRHMRRAVGETMDAALSLRPITTLTKGFSTLGKAVPDFVDLLRGDYGHDIGAVQVGSRQKMKGAVGNTVNMN